jgi:glutaredoxin
MADFHIISQPNCVWCDRAKALLTERGFSYTEDVLDTHEKKAVFKARGFTTVPQISQGTRHIGGYTELAKELS